MYVIVRREFDNVGHLMVSGKFIYHPSAHESAGYDIRLIRFFSTKEEAQAECCKGNEHVVHVANCGFYL